MESTNRGAFSPDETNEVNGRWWRVVEGFLLKISDSNVSVFGFSAEAHGNGMKVKRTFLWTLRWYDAMLVSVLLLSVGSPPGWHTNLNRPALFFTVSDDEFYFPFYE